MKQTLCNCMPLRSPKGAGMFKLQNTFGCVSFWGDSPKWFVSAWCTFETNQHSQKKQTHSTHLDPVQLMCPTTSSESLVPAPRSLAGGRALALLWSACPMSKPCSNRKCKVSDRNLFTDFEIMKRLVRQLCFIRVSSSGCEPSPPIPEKRLVSRGQVDTEVG